LTKPGQPLKNRTFNSIQDQRSIWRHFHNLTPNKNFQFYPRST